MILTQIQFWDPLLPVIEESLCGLGQEGTVTWTALTAGHTGYGVLSRLK